MARQERLRQEREAAGPLIPRACEKYDLGLCFDQEDCKDAHPMSGRAPFGTIKCAIGLPTFERATRMKPGWICKKGSGCLYDHDGYSKERVAEAKVKWQNRRRATRRDEAKNRNPKAPHPRAHARPPYHPWTRRTSREGPGSLITVTITSGIITSDVITIIKKAPSSTN